jgi:hypothetical protein
VDEISKACGTHKKRNASRALLRQSERNKKRTLVRTTRRWEHVIKMDLKGIRWKCVESIYFAQDRDSLLLKCGSNQFSFTKCGAFLD